MNTTPGYDDWKLATPPHYECDNRLPSVDHWLWLLSIAQIAARQDKTIEFSIDESEVYADPDACNVTIRCQFPSHEQMALAFERAAAAIRKAIA